MIICELGFEDADPKRPDYSFREVDFYAWIPFDFRREIPNHRLSLRKNLRTGKFEVYRFYHQSGREEVVFQGDFETALKVGNQEWNRFHSKWAGKKRQPDEPCQHKPPKIDRWFCPMREK